MRWFDGLCNSPAEDFPNGLLEAKAKAVSPRWGLAMLLVLICLIPRAWIAFHWDLVWTDSITYLRAAEAIERGDLQQAFQETGLNTYPVILVALRRMGMDWTVAGKWWSVLMATAAILPLFGWIRRQFDDQVATFACLAYVVHAKLLAISPLIIRDATFWFLFNLTLYLLWRAVTEIRWHWFLGAGVALTLAVHTRSEGWPLVVPVVLWSAYRLPAVRGLRLKLVLGAGLCLAMIPFSMVLVNATWLRDAPRWNLIRQAHIEILQGWLHSEPALEPAKPLPKPPPQPTAEATGGDRLSMMVDTDPMGVLPAPLSKGALLRKVGGTLVKAYTYVLGFLALIGVSRWWRVYLRRDHQTLLLMAAVLLAMIWIRSTYVRCDIRYFFPMVLVSLPWMALGFLKISDWIVRFTSWCCNWTPSRRCAMVLVLAVIVALLSATETNLASAHFMHEHVELGKWIRNQFGPYRTVLANIRETRLVQYYSQGQILGFLDPLECVGEKLPPAIRDGRPDILLLWTDPTNRDLWARYAETVAAQPELGYRQLAQEQLPPEQDHVKVLVRVAPKP